MTNVIPNPGPKARFQEEKSNLEAHRKLIENDALQAAFDYAMLEYQATLISQAGEANASVAGNAAAAAHFRLLGAHEFVAIFKKLSEQSMAPTIVTRDNLNHKV